MTARTQTLPVFLTPKLIEVATMPLDMIQDDGRFRLAGSADRVVQQKRRPKLPKQLVVVPRLW